MNDYCSLHYTAEDLEDDEILAIEVERLQQIADYLTEKLREQMKDEPGWMDDRYITYFP